MRVQCDKSMSKTFAFTYMQEQNGMPDFCFLRNCFIKLYFHTNCAGVLTEKSWQKIFSDDQIKDLK